MLALRYAYVLALVVWLGGMAVTNVLAAPTIFAVLEAGAPLVGHDLADHVVRAILGRFHDVAYGCGATLLLSFVAMAILGPRPANFAVRTGIILAMIAVTVYSGLFVLTASTGAAGLLLAGRLMGVNMVGALVLLYWEAREHAQ
jgi:hypothetical protein